MNLDGGGGRGAGAVKDGLSANLGLGFLALLLVASAPAVADETAGVEVYPALPDHLYQSAHYQVTVEQKGRQFPCYVYQSDNHGDLDAYQLERMTAANHFTSFSFQGPVTVGIQLLGDVVAPGVLIHPFSRGLKGRVKGRSITLELEKAGQYYIAIPGREKHPLFLFADPLERKVPAPQDPGVLYFRPGLHDVGETYASLSADTTVYIAGGAYVKGLFKAKPGVRIAFQGRGVLSGVAYPHYTNGWSHHLIEVPRSDRGELLVAGITLTDSPKGCIVSSVKTTVENVKFLGWHSNTDGVGTGDDSVVKNCFFKVNDDVIKLYASGMRVTDNTIWLQPTGAGIQLSWNLTRPVTNVLVSGVDFIHFDRREPPVGYPFVNNAIVGARNFSGGRIGPMVTIENVRFDETPFQLFGLRTKQAGKYSEGRGSIEGILFRHWTMPAAPCVKSLIDGNGTETGAIENLVFEDIMLGHTRLTSTNTGEFMIQRNKTSHFVYR